MAKTRTPLTPAEEQALDTAIARHNELCEIISEFIMTHQVGLTEEDVVFDTEPPRDLFIEYYNNFVDNIQKYEKAGYVSPIIKGVA